MRDFFREAGKTRRKSAKTADLIRRADAALATGERLRRALLELIRVYAEPVRRGIGAA